MKANEEKNLRATKRGAHAKKETSITKKSRPPTKKKKKRGRSPGTTLKEERENADLQKKNKKGAPGEGHQTQYVEGQVSRPGTPRGKKKR